ncbi:MAG: AEC family transporter [Anaerolineales bacterium]|nr:AEC family transporter [Anaerolineales bacterium]
MSGLLVIFLNNLLPVILACGAGYLLARLLDVSPQALSRVIFYIFGPCLIFTLLIQSELSDGDILRVGLFTTVVVALVGALAFLGGKIANFERRTLAGLLLASMFMNAGNFGMPIALFAFGENALSYASLFFVANAILVYTVGVMVASMGSASLSQAFINLFKVPFIYALALALVFMHTGWRVPLPLERTVELLGDASIPAMLVLLGMQLASANLSGQAAPIFLATGMRLLISPLLALALGPVFGLVGAARQAVTLEAAMPTAVLTTVLATEYDTHPTLVTSTVFVSTLLSPLTLTPLMAFLGA